MVGIIKKKILFYAGTCELVGGDTKYFCNLVNAFDENDDFDLIVTTDKNKSFEERAKQWLKNDIGVRYLPTRPVIKNKSFLSFLDFVLPFNFFGRKLSKYFDLLIHIVFLLFLLDFIHNFRIFNSLFKAHKDIKIFHCNSGSFPGRIAGIAGVLAARVNNCPKIIMTIHNEANVIFDPLSFFYDYVVRSYCHHIISVSANVQNSLINIKNFNPDNLTIVTIGLQDYKAYVAKNNHSSEDDRLKILIIGNYEEKRKGHEQLFHTIKILALKYPNISLIVVGSGSAKRMLFLEKLAEDLKIEKNIEWLGYIENIGDIIASSHIMAVPSIGPEAIPYTIIEGLRAGKPVLTSHKGGCKEAVLDGFNGFVVDPLDVESMANKFSILLDNRDKIATFGRNSREMFLSKFIQEDKIKEHLNLYCSDTA
jgi:glycosyltransferase involved in cell wall biosynthesis